MSNPIWECNQFETTICQSNQVQDYRNWQCDTTVYGIGGRGVTYWGHHSGGMGAIIQSSGYAEFSFTCTEPKCYATHEACNVSFNAYPNADANGPYVALGYELNDVGGEGNDAYLSSVSGHGAWQATELCNITQTPYLDRGLNIFRIHNHSNVSVTIEHLQILRVYEMCNLMIEMAPQQGCTDPQGGSGCSEGNNYGLLGNLDPTNQYYTGRQDFPCNSVTCGGRSYTAFKLSPNGYGLTTARTIDEDNGCLDVYFDFSPASNSNYIRGDVCLFNFNPMFVNQGYTSSQADVKMEAYLNDNTEPFATYFLSKLAECLSAPSFNLMNADGYVDNGRNHVRLINRSDVPVYLNDPYINIYRTYVTNGICGSGCQSCYAGQSCWPCYGFCQTCVTACELCESSYNWCELCESSYTWPCEICESQCYTSCNVGCEISCQGGCQSCVGCQACESCNTCVASNASCDPGCYDCQACNACEPSCYDAQTCYACQVTCFDCEQCYAYY